MSLNLKRKESKSKRRIVELNHFKNVHDAQLLLIGFGGLGKCSLEFLTILKGWFPKELIQNIVIIEPKSLQRDNTILNISEQYVSPLPNDTKYEFLNFYKDIIHVQVAITEKNIDSLLTRILPGKRLILDASVSVNGLHVMKHAWKHNCVYINTSMENWSTSEDIILDHDPKKLYQRTLKYQDNKAIRYFRNHKNSNNPIMITQFGLNPGAVSHFAKRGVQDLFEYNNKNTQNNKLLQNLVNKCKNCSCSKGDICGLKLKKYYKYFARSSGVHTIHVAELDTQTLAHGLTRKTNTFYNTWSVPGFVVEAIDPIQLGFGSEKHLPSSLKKFIAQNKSLYEADKKVIAQDKTKDLFDENNEDVTNNILFFHKHGYDATTKTTIIDPRGTRLETIGYIIPHGEANTLSSYLSSKKSPQEFEYEFFKRFHDKTQNTFYSKQIKLKQIKSENYVPNVYYVYHPSVPSLTSIKTLKKLVSAEKLKQKKTHAQNLMHETRVLDQGDLNLNEGFDSMGAFIKTTDKSKVNWWSGTILTAKQARAYGMKYAGPTICQVAISFLAGARWAYENPNCGFLSPEHLCTEKMIKWTRPYLGKVISIPIPKK